MSYRPTVSNWHNFKKDSTIPFNITWKNTHLPVVSVSSLSFLDFFFPSLKQNSFTKAGILGSSNESVIIINPLISQNIIIICTCVDAKV